MGEGEAPPLPTNDKLKVIGKPTARVDGRAKVTGAAKYSADVNLPNMLYAAMITSDVAHAKVKSIDTSAAERYPGVKAVHLLDKVAGIADVKGEDNGKYPQVRFAGQPLGAIAATSQNAANEAVRLVQIEYDEQPFVIDATAAKEKDAPVVYQGNAVTGGSAGGGGGAHVVSCGLGHLGVSCRQHDGRAAGRKRSDAKPAGDCPVS